MLVVSGGDAEGPQVTMDSASFKRTTVYHIQETQSPDGSPNDI